MHHLSLATIAVILLMATPVRAQSDQLGVPGPISFEDQTYALAGATQPNENYFKQEYVPQGQSVETYSEMILVEAVTGAITPMQAAALQVQSLEARKGTDPLFNFDIIQNEATGEVLLDFLISDLAADPVVVEWNAYRYAPLDKGDGVALFRSQPPRLWRRRRQQLHGRPGRDAERGDQGNKRARPSDHRYRTLIQLEAKVPFEKRIWRRSC